MNSETPDAISKFLSALDNISGWTFGALAISTAFLLYWPYKVGVDLVLLRSEYGGWLFVVMVISLCLVAARLAIKIQQSLASQKTKRAFHFTPIELQCWWSSTEQKDGRVFTQMLADCNVLNLTDQPLFFSFSKIG